MRTTRSGSMRFHSPYLCFAFIGLLIPLVASPTWAQTGAASKPAQIGAKASASAAPDEGGDMTRAEAKALKVEVRKRQAQLATVERQMKQQERQFERLAKVREQTLARQAEIAAMKDKLKAADETEKKKLERELKKLNASLKRDTKRMRSLMDRLVKTRSRGQQRMTDTLNAAAATADMPSVAAPAAGGVPQAGPAGPFSANRPAASPLSAPKAGSAKRGGAAAATASPSKPGSAPAARLGTGKPAANAALGVGGRSVVAGAVSDTPKPGMSGAVGQAGGAMPADDMIQQNAQMNMQFLQIQKAMQNESRQYNAVSNALKVRHDAAMSAVRNMK